MSTEEVQSSLLKIAFLCIGGLLVLGLASFWCPPTYQDGVETALSAFKEVLGWVVLGKAALAVPGTRQNPNN